MSREKKKDCMNCLHYDMMEGKKIIQRMFILHRLRKENNMRKNIQVKVKVPQFTVITGLMYAQRDSWFGHTMQDLKMDLIYPEDKERKYPCIVWICGGAWLQMDRSAHLAYLSELARKGFTVLPFSTGPAMKPRFQGLLKM